MIDETIRLMWSVQALALDADAQFDLFPGFVSIADELALALEEALEGLADPWPLEAEVLDAVRNLDQQILGMSGPEHLDLWTDEAIRMSSEWSAVRTLARAVLATAAWPLQRPPRGRAIYVGPPD